MSIMSLFFAGLSHLSRKEGMTTIFIGDMHIKVNDICATG